VDKWQGERRLPLHEALGSAAAAARYLELQNKSRLLRSDEEAEEYKALQTRYTAGRRAHWRAERERRAAGGAPAPVAPPSPPPPDPRQTTIPEAMLDAPAHEPPAVAVAVPVVELPVPGRRSPGAQGVADAAPDGADDDDDDDADDGQDGTGDDLPSDLAAAALDAPPPPPDAPEVIEDRAAWLKKRLRTPLAAWSSWLQSYGVWHPPAFAEKWVAKTGAEAARGFHFLDRVLAPKVAAAGFAAGVLVLWGVPSLFALRRWRDGAPRKVVDATGEPAPAREEDGREAAGDDAV